jgi:hypothetical protein
MGPKDLNVADIGHAPGSGAPHSFVLGLDGMRPNWHGGDKICRTNS